MGQHQFAPVFQSDTDNILPGVSCGCVGRKIHGFMHHGISLWYVAPGKPQHIWDESPTNDHVVASNTPDNERASAVS